MAKRKNRSKRSTARPPKGLPTKDVANVNPFEVTHRQKRPKFHVHNRLYEPSLQSKHTSKTRKTSALAVALQERRSELKQASKANVFSDQRIGIRSHMTPEDATVARLVRERTRQSKRASQFQLDDDVVITHRGEPITNSSTHFDPGHVMLDEEEQGTDLDETETSMHFGGGGSKSDSAYGHSDLSSQYMSRKTELDEMIMRRKVQKAERQQSKGDQVDAFSAMDGNFRELSRLLSFRDKDKAEMEHVEAKREGRLNDDDQEMAEWDMQMKQFSLATNKVKATDRTRTPEEIAKEEADRLHDLETRRLARMQGDFENDDLSDVDDNDDEGAEGLDSDKEDDADPKSSTSIRFTADGLVRIDGDGNVVGRAFDNEDAKEQAEGSCGVAAFRDKAPTTLQKLHKVGSKVMASYCAQDQTDGKHSWFSGKIVKVDAARGRYDVEYDDGDFEADVLPEHVSVMETASDESEKVGKIRTDGLKLKRRKAAMKARSEMPFVFEVPSTLDELNDLIAMHATTGEEASLVVQRIHKANSVRLNRLNADKMQNFYDILLRRFIAIGDALHEKGNGGVVGRYSQLDTLTKTLYEMAQDSPEGAAATWSRRLGFMHSAHVKRTGDVAFEQDETFSAWPSTGTFLALRLVGHIFPVTDKRHCITTPTILFLGQILVHTPILLKQDLVMGMLCCGLLLEYTKGAKRISPEAHAFLDGTLRLISLAKGGPLPTLEAAADLLKEELVSLEFEAGDHKLSIEKAHWERHEVYSSVISSALCLLESTIGTLSGSISDTEPDVFSKLAEALLCLPTKRFSKSICERISSVVSKLHLSPRRRPLRRSDVQKKQVKTLAPRIENTSVGRKNTKSEADRLRHELKREHKSTKRDIRLDASVVESERRQKEAQDREKAQSRRQKAFAWMEQEQATVNNQVRQGGGLLHGGGMGAAKAKAKSAKVGMKKGGKF